MQTHYQVLGVPEDATQADIDKAWKQELRQCHPDRGGDLEKAIALNNAHDVLSDPIKRSECDRMLSETRGCVRPILGPGVITFGVYSFSADEIAIKMMNDILQRGTSR